jgi:hypothetical protein
LIARSREKAVFSTHGASYRTRTIVIGEDRTASADAAEVLFIV